MIKSTRKILTNILLLIGINFLFILFLTATFCIPADGKIKEHLGASLYTWEKENKSPIFDNTENYWNDLGSDMLLANIVAQNVDSPWKAAIENKWISNDYEGEGESTYQYLIQGIYMQDSDKSIYNNYVYSYFLIVGILRILFFFWELFQIRYFFRILITILMGIVLFFINQKLGWRGIVPFLVAIIPKFWLMQTTSFTTMTDILVTIVAMLVILINYSKKWFNEYQNMFFMVIGAITFAAGYFVAPLLSLGFCLILLIQLRQTKDCELKNWALLINNSVWWVIGYGGSMFLKSKIATMFHFKSQADGKIMYYLGLEHGIIDRIKRIVYCFKGYMSPISVKMLFFVLLLIVLLFFMYRNGTTKNLQKYQLLFLSCYPLGWIFIIYEHSQHYWVANIVSIFVYAIISIVTFSINENEKKKI